jgi:diguanylate cyclase (GGDEF)-like protein
MNTNILQEKINIIARNTNSISFTYEISSDQMHIVQHQDQKEVKLDLDYYCKGLLDGTYGHLEDRDKIEDMYKHILNGKREIQGVFRTNIPDGSFHWVQCYGKTIFGKDKIPEKIIGWMTPTTHLQELMLIMLDHLNDDYSDTTFNNLYLEYVSKFFSVDATYFMGYGANNQREFEYHWNVKTYDFLHFMDINFSQITNEIKSNQCVELSLGDRLKIGLISSKIKSACLIKKTVGTENKEYFLLLISCKEKRTWYKKEIDVLQWLISALTITEERNYAVKENAELKKKLSKDQITGLSKIETFKSNTDYIIDSNPDKMYAIVHSGFYNFQFINDNFGYAIGDAILNRFGKFMKNNLRSGRAYSRGSGDQFVFLIEYQDIITAKEEFIATCKRFCNSIEQEIGVNSLIITSGICHVKREGSQKISKAIDNAHMTRKAIRNRAETSCLIFKDSARANVAEQMKIAANMKRALQNEEFVVYLQPKTDLATGKLVGAEALVRWQLDNGSMIFPDQFIPLFEENGFISQIDFYVLQRVLIYLVERKRKGLKLITISVNFSRRHQENPNFVSDIVALMDEYGIERKWIEIEITESAFMKDIHKLNDNLIRLRENHISVSIDDFGSGYSSLNVLSTVPADVIKIDRAFLYASDEKSINMLKYLVLMIKGMGYKTIAEGVETKEQVLLLREIGCELAQGYFYAKPMPMKEFNQYCLEVPM